MVSILQATPAPASFIIFWSAVEMRDISKRSLTDLQTLASYRVLYRVHLRSKRKTRSNSVSESACFVLYYFVKKDSCKGRKSLNIKYPTVCVCGMVYTGSSIVKFMFVTNFRVVH